MSRFPKIGILVVVSMGLSVPALADTITYATNPKLGCFAQTGSCAPSSSTPATFNYVYNTSHGWTAGDITFVGAGTAATATAPSGSSTFTLGTFTLDDAASTSNAGVVNMSGYFAVTIPFATPTVNGGSPTFDAAFSGTISKNTDGTVSFTFGQPQLLTYKTASGSGSFDLTVNAMTIHTVDGRGADYGSGQLMAAISNATYTPNPAPVEEPTSLLLLGSGILGVARIAYCRR